MKRKYDAMIFVVLFAAILFFARGTIDAQAASVGSGNGNIDSSNRTCSYSLTLPSSGRIKCTIVRFLNQKFILKIRLGN